MKRSFIYLPLLLGFFLLLSGCRSTHNAAAPSQGKALPVVPEETRRQLTELFLESTRQKHKQAYDAQMELLNKMLELNPNSSEALYEKAWLYLLFSRSYDTLRIAEAKDLLC